MKNLLLVMTLAFFALSCASTTNRTADSPDKGNKIERVDLLELRGR